MQVLITTVPFGKGSQLPIDILNKAGVSFTINPYGRKLTEEELEFLIPEYDVVIAGTEPITGSVLQKAKRLKMISRVGIGLDSVNLLEARRRGISISYTPEAPSPAVAELTIGLILSLLRKVQLSNLRMRSGEWQRYFGSRLAHSVVGIIGVGRIGTKVLTHLSSFGCDQILVNDIIEKNLDNYGRGIEWCDKEYMYRQADVISLHLPLTVETKNLIGVDQLELMKPEAVLINTSRGGIINETDLYEVMQRGHLSGAAIDVFTNEPYSGPLTEIERCILTAHMGSMSDDCRELMEVQATEEAVRFVCGQPLMHQVPHDEYDLQQHVSDKA